MSQDKIAKYLENRIRELEKRIRELSEELEILKELATEYSKSKQISITATASEVKTPPQEKEKVKVLYVENEIIASEVISDDLVKIVLRSGLKSDDEVVANFLLKVLEELRERGDLTDYKIQESGGYIIQIDLIGPNPLALRQAELALKYVWSKVAAS